MVLRSPSIHRHDHNDHCRTKVFSAHLYQLLIYPMLLKQASYLISSSSSLTTLPCFTIAGLPFCFPNSPFIICSSHDVICPCPFFSFNYVQDVFNFILLPNSCYSFYISMLCQALYSLHSTSGAFIRL